VHLRRKFTDLLPRDDRYNRAIDFRYGRPHHGYFGLLERWAVMVPLVGPLKPGDNYIKGAASLVTNRYRELLRIYEQADLLTHDEARQLGNCRLAFTQVKPQSWVRDNTPVCPHCSARQAVTVWQRVDGALFPILEDGSRPERAEYDLLFVRRSFGREALQAYRGPTGCDLAAVFLDHCMNCSPSHGRPIPSRGREMQRLRPHFAGAVDGIFVVANSKGWWVSIRQLFAVDPGIQLAIPGAKIERFTRPPRGCLPGPRPDVALSSWALHHC
jgi:hypothetical protein